MNAIQILAAVSILFLCACDSPSGSNNQAEDSVLRKTVTRPIQAAKGLHDVEEKRDEELKRQLEIEEGEER